MGREGVVAGSGGALALPHAVAPIETERLRLRVVNARDVDAIHAVQSREDVCRYLPFAPRSRDEIDEKVTGWAAGGVLAADGDLAMLAIERREDDVVLGHIHAELSSVENASATVGWALHPDFAGQGYASEAARALLRELFGRVGLHRVFAWVRPENLASAALCRRLGMRIEAEREHFGWLRGDWRNLQVWAVLDREFAAAEAGAPAPAGRDFVRDVPYGVESSDAPDPALPAEFPGIRTERLQLRLLTADDVDAVHRYQSREDVCRYLLFEPRTRDEVAAKLAEHAAHTTLASRGDYWQLAVERTGDGAVIGDLYFALAEPGSAAAEIGWTFHPDAHGQGFATEAAAALLDFAFDTLRLHRVAAEFDPRNERSIALCRRLSMVEEAHYLEDLWFKGAWADTGQYARLRVE